MGLVDYAASDDDEKSAASSDNNSSSPSTDDESDRPAILKSLPSVHAAEKSDRGHQEEELEDVVKPRDWEKKLAEKAQKKKPASGESKERKKKSKKEKKDKRKKVEDRAKQPKGRAKIAAFGALQTLDDSSSDEDSALPRPSTGPSSSAQLSAEALGTVGSKLGLFAALPKPKAATTVTTKLLVPTSVRAASALKPKAESLGQKKEAPKATATVNHSGGVKSDDDDDDDDDEAEGDGSDFFGFKKSAPSLAPSTDAAAPSALAPEVRLGSLAGPERPADQDEYNFGYEDDLVDEEDGPSSSSAIDKDHLPPTKRAKTITDDEAARLIFKHEMAPWGMDARFAAEAVTSMRSVSADDAIGDDIQQTLLRNLNHRQMATASAQQTAPKVKTSNDKDAKRRNQITYLANLAVSREEQMQNRWAEGNQKKRQTREKYGF